MEVIIAGGGIGGLTLALELHEKGIACRVYEAVAEIKPVGVGVTLLPHSTKVLGRLGLNEELAKYAVSTTTTSFFNRFGQHIYSEATGAGAGYRSPQFQVHRADLHKVLLDACRERIGAERIVTGARCVGFEQARDGVTIQLAAPDGSPLSSARADALIACDGLHSVVRKILHPEEGEPKYSGVNMWRGVTRCKPILDGATYIRAGWLTPGKMVIYPIRNALDGNGLQLINWVVEVTTPNYQRRDWNRQGRLEDFIHVFEDWKFPWLDVPQMIRSADVLLEFPMIDQDPLAWWTKERVTLLGDAAHPMVPRGSNGAGQAILDASTLANCLAEAPSVEAALRRYEQERLAATSNIVRTNRSNPPDAILREVYERTGDTRFEHIEEVISNAEMAEMLNRYKQVAGYDLASLGH